MENLILTPPVALLANLILVALLAQFGRLLAGPASPSAMKASTYSSGEQAPTGMAAPGYKPFFVIALFFAILHLGVLMLGSASLSPVAAIYLAALMLCLLALILG